MNVLSHPRLVVVGTAAAALSAAALGAWFTGAVTPSLLVDPGALVRWGLPSVEVAGDLLGALTLGLAGLLVTALPITRTRTARGRLVTRAYRPGFVLLSAAAAGWALCEVAKTLGVFADVSGLRWDDPTWGGQLGAFLGRLDLGRGLALTTLLAAGIAVVAAGATSATTAAFLGLAAVVAMVPQALAGHASGGSDHETAVTALGLHVLGVSVWVGGLAGLVLLQGRLGPALPVAVRRFSPVAAWCLVAVAGSGVLSAAVRLGSLGALGGRYGLLVLAKTAALIVIGGLGLWHRRRVLPTLETAGRRAFALLAAVELVIMGVASGLGAALSRSAPPAPAGLTPPSPAQLITGYPMPPAPTASRWLTEWQPDLFWVLITALAAGLYVTAVHRLRARGDRWPARRTVVWLLGVAIMFWDTSGSPAVYGRVLFSVHMLGHLALSMLVPILLVCGAPVTLALRAVAARHDGTRGLHEWVLAALESRYARLVTHPAVAAVLFAGSLIVFYYSPLFGVALTTHVGHEIMHVHFLLSGYLFVWVLMGLDPGPRRPSAPARLVILLATMGFHAFFGVALISGTAVLQPGYFGALGRTWGSGPLADQRLGGGLAWGIGDLPTLVIALVIAVQWAASDSREARRLDRAADRDGDAELTAYNAMLARLATAPGAAAGGSAQPGPQVAARTLESPRLDRS